MSVESWTFVFADLAGFTALTEVHGDEFAAEIAESFCVELNRVLPDGGVDLKSLGDACMVLVPDAADALVFGRALVERVGAGRPFPQVRVGMHTGTAVARHGDVFGRAVNLAARVAGRAGPGEALATATTWDDAGDGAPPGGAWRRETLRHVAAPVEVRAVTRRGRDPVVDPICGLRIVASSDADGRAPGFCSDVCARIYERAPERRLGRESPPR